ncbi:MAG: hypothetical protein WBM62_08245, partial [Crocosphaera sp.]
DMGILAMKVIRPRENINSLQPSELIRYSLSLENISGVVIGMESLAVLKDNIDVIKNFRPLSSSKIDEISVKLTPFYQNKNLAWMKPWYQDGMQIS